MFETLSDRFESIFKRLRAKGRLTASDVDEVAREIRLALLEADVNVRVVKQFITRLKERANGAEVAKSLSPGQQVIKIVHDELVETLGGASGKLTIASEAADRHHARRPPGFREDDRRGEARAAARTRSGASRVAGRCRPAAARGRRAAPGPR